MKQYSFILVESTYIQQITKDPTWQKLRQSLVGTWMKTPTQSCKKLNQYIGNISKCNKVKLQIVRNYLTGTAFRIGKIKHPCIDKLLNNIRNELKRRSQTN